MISRIVLIALVLAFGATAAGPAAAIEARLRPSVVVDEPLVTLGDLLTDAGAAADAVVARAPAPGRRMVVSVSLIFRVARANGLDWKPERGLDRVVVTRAGQRIPKSEIEAHLIDALKDIAPGENLRIDLRGRSIEIVLPTTAPRTVEIENLVLDRARGRVTATVVAAAGTPYARRANIAGRVYTVAELPVPRHTLRRGEVIDQGDLEWVELRTDRLRRQPIDDPAEIVGQAARRTLRAGQPLYLGDLRAPVIVAKGSNVTMTYRTRSMVLTTVGKALEDGGQGETIRVLNTQTNTIIDAKVEGSGMVVVTSRRQLALN